jgi:hypothetical protein
MVAAAGMLLALGGCGSTDTMRASTGGLGGAAAGAVVGGPVGAVVGGAGGAAAGMAMDEGAVHKAERWTGLGDKSGQSGSTGARSGGESASGRSMQALSPQRIRAVQQALNDNGSDIGVDGVWGPNTRRALRDFQRSKGLDATGQLNRDTVAALNLGGGQDTGAQSGGSGQQGGRNQANSGNSENRGQAGNSGSGDSGQPDRQ